MKRSLIAMILALSVVLTAAPAIAHGGGDSHAAPLTLRDRIDLTRAFVATARYHSFDKALRDGFEAFAIPVEVGGSPTTLPGNPSCFDNATGGMGVHYVKGIDDKVSPTQPEALVYELRSNGKPRLVALEYIVPQEFVENDLGEVVALPELFGQGFHKHPYLPVYILHVWLFSYNPSGLFADWNPRVGQCPG
jgi:hypothetical protein